MRQQLMKDIKDERHIIKEIRKKFIKTDEVITKKCEVSINNNHWANNNIVKDWMETMYFSYFNNIQFENNLLIYDSASMHFSLDTNS